MTLEASWGSSSFSEMRGGWWCRFGYLGGVFEAERRRFFTGGTFIFAKEPSVASSLIQGSLDSGVSNKIVPFGGRSA